MAPTEVQLPPKNLNIMPMRAGDDTTTKINEIIQRNDEVYRILREYVENGLSDVNIISPLEANGGIPVNLQDQTTPPVLIYANQIICTTTLTAATALDDYTVSVVDASLMSVGDYTGIFNIEGIRFYAGTILSINVNDITFDTPIDFKYQIGDTVQCGTKEMNVDGSITPQIFSLRADPGLDIEVDVTRIIIHITDNTAMDDSRFGGILALTNGVVLRRVDGSYLNILNVKTNGEIGELAFDKTYDDRAPSGFFGLTARLTFAGQSKIGVAIRLGPDEDLQVIIQDDLTGLESFRIMIEGHVVQDIV